jgi:serine/threonine protein phosphatase PrpC
MQKTDTDFQWAGSNEGFIDQPVVINIGKIEIGRFGGNSSAGQSKNEDACLVWSSEAADWEFAVLLDAHQTADSAEAVLAQVDAHKEKLTELLDRSLQREFFRILEGAVLAMFQQEEFLARCRNLQGETACLLAMRKGKYVWWFSVGDCLLYLLHPELEALGQHQLNQRQFYEWIGQVNTFEGAVPCYSSGTRELRQGVNRLLLATDGLVECPGGPYAEPAIISRALGKAGGMGTMLQAIQQCGVRDSTTVISWEITVQEPAAMPSDH